MVKEIILFQTLFTGGARKDSGTDQQEESGMKIFSWEFLISLYLVVVTVFLLAGCSTPHSLRMGDTPYTAGGSLHKHEDVNLD